MDQRDFDQNVKLDVEFNRVLYEFPEGFSPIPLIEECRALNKLDDFDFMYDITMQLLVGKPVLIYLRGYTGQKHLMCKFIVTDRYMDLRGVDAINQFPILVNWMVRFVAGYLGKKYPRPSVAELQPTTSRTRKKPTKGETSP